MSVTKPAGAAVLAVGGSLLASAVFSLVLAPREDWIYSLEDYGVLQVFHDRLQAIDDDEWLHLLRSARNRYGVLGVANHGYVRQPVWRTYQHEIIEAVTQREVSVEFLWLDPDCDAAQVRDREEGRGTIRDIIDSILALWELRESLGAQPDAQRRLALKTYERTPTTAITWIDNHLIVTHYLATELNLHAPGILLEDDVVRRMRQRLRGQRCGEFRSELATKYSQHYEIIRDSGTELTADRIEELRRRRREIGDGPSEADLR